MKKLLAILAVCALVVPAYAANIFNNVETYGEVQTIGAKVEKYQDSDLRTTNRVIFGLGMDLVEDVRANVAFINTSTWGDNNTSANVGQGQSINGFFDEIFVAEANVVVSNIFGAWEAKIGRQFYGDENSKIIYFGPTHGRANLAVQSDAYSLDAAVLTYNSDKFLTNFIYGKIASRAAAPTGLDASIAGVDFTTIINDNFKAQAYWYDIQEKDNASPHDHSGIFGVKPSFAAGAIAASVEFAKNYEGGVFESVNKGWMLAADASIKLNMADFDLAPRASFYKTEKDFESVGNYAPGLFFGGVATGRLSGTGDNFEVFNAGMDARIAALDKVTFALDYYALSAGPTDNAAWVGNEFDLTANYMLNEYVAFNAGIAFITNANMERDPYMGQLGMLIKF